MSRETLEYLNSQTLIGNTDQRGTAWHYRAEEQGEESNHYAGPIPVADVQRRLFAWQAASRRVAVEVPADPATCTTWPSMRPITGQFREEAEAFKALAYTIGGMMVFPGNRIGTKQTLNGARGFHPKIKDRFDLTLECIRRHYAHMLPNPLGDVLDRYADFFGLFDDFSGYVDYFLLQDLVSDDQVSVQFFLPFDNFKSAPVPTNVDSYMLYRHNATEFLRARNRRIGQLNLD